MKGKLHPTEEPRVGRNFLHIDGSVEWTRLAEQQYEHGAALEISPTTSFRFVRRNPENK